MKLGFSFVISIVIASSLVAECKKSYSKSELLDLIKVKPEKILCANDDLRKNEIFNIKVISSNCDQYNCDIFKYISKDLQNNRLFIKKLIEENGNILKYISNDFKKDKEIVLAAIKNKCLSGESLLQFADNSLKNDKRFVLKAISINQSSFREVSDELKNDKDVVLAAVNAFSFNIEYLSKKMQNDRDVILAAGILKYSDIKFKNDKELILSIIKKETKEQNNKESMKDIKGACYCLKHAGKSIKNNKSYLLKLVGINEYVMSYIDDSLLKDENFIFNLVKTNPKILFAYRGNLYNDKDKKIKYILREKKLSDRLNNIKEIVLAKVRHDGYSLSHVKTKFKKDKEVVLAAVGNFKPSYSSMETPLKDADKSLKTDKEFILTASKINVNIVGDMDKSLKTDREFIRSLVKINGKAILYSDKKFKSDRELILLAVKSYGRVLDYVDKKLKDDKEIVLSAIKGDVDTLRYASEKLKNDMDFILPIIEKRPKALTYAGKEIKKNRHFVMAEHQIEDDSSNSKKYILAAIDKIKNDISLKK